MRPDFLLRLKSLTYLLSYLLTYLLTYNQALRLRGLEVQIPKNLFFGPRCPPEKINKLF